MNVELLRKVKDAILEEPLRIDMSAWIGSSRSSYSFPPCGTIGCIYGWGQAILTGLRAEELRSYVHNIKEEGCALRNRNNPVWKKTDNIFDLTPEQQEKLYFIFNWPRKFRVLVDDEYPEGRFSKVYLAQTPEYAQVVAARIEHMIEHGE